MEKLTIHKAGDMPDKPVEGAVIEISPSMDEVVTLESDYKDILAFYESEATALHAILQRNLCGGVYSRLASLMLQHIADNCYFKVPQG